MHFEYSFDDLYFIMVMILIMVLILMILRYDDDLIT